MFKRDYSSNRDRPKIDGYFFHKILRCKILLSWFLLSNRKTVTRRAFILKGIQITLVPLKGSTTDFKIAPLLRDQHIFMQQSLKIFNLFNALNLK